MSKVVIIGAGIGGLTTALSLHAAGMECTVVDRVPRLSPLGVGINLQPHAVRELTELGLGDDLDAIAVRTAIMVHLDRFGNRIWSKPCGRGAGYNWPQYSIHRGELQMLLLRAVTQRLGDDAVLTGHALDSFEEETDRVTFTLRNSSDGTTSTLDADVMIGADGLYSTVRSQLHPGEGAPIGNGIRMWRGIAQWPTFETGATMIAAGSNSATKFVAYPIAPPTDGYSLTNWVAEVRSSDPQAVADWTMPGRLSDALPHFEGWDFGWLNVPELIAASDPILEYPMVDRDPLPYWSTDKVTLVGDAAHPMYPIASNGGSQAIIDARVLAYRLRTENDTASALRQYEKDRREPTASIVEATRNMGQDRILALVAQRAPDGFADVRDVLSEEELAEIEASYRRTTMYDVDWLNARASWD